MALYLVLVWVASPRGCGAEDYYSRGDAWDLRARVEAPDADAAIEAAGDHFGWGAREPRRLALAAAGNSRLAARARRQVRTGQIPEL